MVPLARLLMGGHVYTSGVLPFLRGSSHLAPGVPSHLVIIHDPPSLLPNDVDTASLTRRAKIFCFSPSC